MQTRLSRRAFLAVSALAGASCVTSCHDTRAPSIPIPNSLRYDGPTVSLTYWNGFTGADSATMAALVREFNSSQADITVVTRTYPWPAFYSNLHDLTQRGVGPDVGVLQADHLATEASAKLIAPLDEMIRPLGLRKEDFLAEAWRLGTYQGVRYGIPLDVHCLALFCNSGHLARAGIEPPTDASSFDKACQKLHDAGYAHPCWMPNEYPSLQIFLGLLWQNGGEPYNSEVTAATFSSDEALSALMWMVDQVHKGYSPANVPGDLHWNEFVGSGHENTLEMNGIWQMQAANAAGLPYSLAPMPTIGPQPAQWANSHQMFISRSTAKNEHRLQASLAFLDFLSRQSSAWAAAGMVPARTAERRVGLYTGSRQHVLEPDLQRMRFLPSRPGLPTLTSTTLGTAVRTTLKGRLSPAEARTLLGRASREANAALKHTGRDNSG